MQGNCYNRSPMWPSLGFKPFSTKKQHGFVYMMILDNHINNSLLFSSCVPSHHHWHKLCDFVQMKCVGELEIILFTECPKSQQENVIKVSTY